MPSEADEVQDKDLIYYSRFEAQLRAELRNYITPKLIEEHRLKPVGQHSDPLERVMNYFRRVPAEGKSVLFELETGRKYKIVVTTGQKNKPPVDLDNHIYTDKNEALHAIFLRRVQELMEE